MKLRFISLFIVLFSLFCKNVFSQSGYEVSPSNAFFSFTLPGAPNEYVDTLDVLLVEYNPDSSINMQCVYVRQEQLFSAILDSVAVEEELDPFPDSLKNPLTLYKDVMLGLWDSTSLEDNNSLTTTNPLIHGIELKIKLIDLDNIEKILFARVYSNGADLVCFYIKGPSSRLSDMLALKENLYNSIIIN